MTLPIATIDKLAFGGNGVCRIDGKVCFVPFSCPGDELSLNITTKKKSYSIASINEILTPSTFRTTPECSIFGLCGGCSWQHINYPYQLVQKREILAETLWRGSRINTDKIEQVVSAQFPYGYRSRFQFKVALQGGKLHIGFYKQGSHQVQDAVDGCPIAIPTINKALKSLRTILKSYPAVKSVSQISIDSSDNAVVIIIHNSEMVSPKNLAYLVEQVQESGICTGLFFKTADSNKLQKLWGSPDISYSMSHFNHGNPPLVLKYPPGGFAQVHQMQNSAMLSVIRRLGSFSAVENLLDLYCGNGNFSLPLAAEVASVTGIEGNADSIRAAKFNSIYNKVANARFFCDDVNLALRRLVEEKQKFDTIILDPPRSGAGEAVTYIAKLKPDKIIYISCDPNTLARDCGILASSGYFVVTSVPIDMFPQTFHIESVTLLCK